MKQIKKIVFVLLFLFGLLTLNNVYATECTDEDIETLKALAEKIEFSKKIIEGQDERGTAFSLVGHNLNSNLRLHFQNGLDFVSEKSEQSIMTYLDGNTININVYASEKHVCEDTFVTSLEIKLPVYNKYYNRPECKGKEAADICKEWYDADDVTEEQFLELVQKAAVTNPPIKNQNWFIKFITKYWMIIAGVVLVAAVSYATVLIVRKKKRVKIDI